MPASQTLFTSTKSFSSRSFNCCIDAVPPASCSQSWKFQWNQNIEQSSIKFTFIIHKHPTKIEYSYQYTTKEFPSFINITFTYAVNDLSSSKKQQALYRCKCIEISELLPESTIQPKIIPSEADHEQMEKIP